MILIRYYRSIFRVAMVSLALIYVESPKTSNAGSIDATYRYAGTNYYLGGGMFFDSVTEPFWGSLLSIDYPNPIFRPNGFTKGDYTFKAFGEPSPGTVKPTAYSLTMKGDSRNLLANLDPSQYYFYGFNSNGQLLGRDYTPSGYASQESFLYEPATGSKTYFPSSFSPMALNSQGVVVGFFNGDAGIMQSINSTPELFPPLLGNPKDLSMIRLYDITDAGEIAGTVRDSNFRRGDLIARFFPINTAPTQVPEPATWLVLGAGCLWALRRQRARNAV